MVSIFRIGHLEPYQWWIYGLGAMWWAAKIAVIWRHFRNRNEG